MVITEFIVYYENVHYLTKLCVSHVMHDSGPQCAVMNMDLISDFPHIYKAVIISVKYSHTYLSMVESN